MLVKKVLFLFAALFAICATAEAKTTTDLRAEDHGVLGAMQRMGCTNPQWLGRVLLESNIPIGRVYKLPVGAPIVIPDECEKGAPLSSGDMMMNRAIYGEKAALERIQVMQAASDNLREELSGKEKTIEGQSAIIISLKQELAVLRDQLQRLKTLKPSNPQQVQTKDLVKKIWRTIACWLTVLLMGSTGWALYWFSAYRTIRSESKKEVPPQIIERIKEVATTYPSCHGEHPVDIQFHGKTGHFYDTTVHTVRCVHCSENTILNKEENKEQHLRKAHPHLRLIEVTPQQLRDSLRHKTA